MGNSIPLKDCSKGRTMPYVISTFSDSQVGKDDFDNPKTMVGLPKHVNSPLVNQYSLTVGMDLGPHNTKSLMKCVESLSFIVRDAAHVTPENFELCVKTIRIFVEASLNGGEAKSHLLIFVLWM